MVDAGNGQQQSPRSSFIRTVIAQVAGKLLGRVSVIAMDESGGASRVGAAIRWLLETFGIGSGS